MKYFLFLLDFTYSDHAIQNPSSDPSIFINFKYYLYTAEYDNFTMCIYMCKDCLLGCEYCVFIWWQERNVVFLLTLKSPST